VPLAPRRAGRGRMPIAEEVLGFSSRWYPSAIRAAQTPSIGGHNVQVIAPVSFVATKLEAFRGRGQGDVTLSHDLEDVVTLVDGRPGLVNEVAAAEPDVRSFIASEIAVLMANPEFREALPGFLLPDPASQARRSILEQRLSAIAALDKTAGT
jgi:hypothetical protein